jgi:hypothetical protein
MSLYQVQSLIYQRLKRFGAGTDDGVVHLDGYELSDDERQALKSDDVGALYRMGVHPVLINAYCRCLGILRDDYRRLLAPYARSTAERPRWRR